jgi:hypothetical protein
MSSIEPGTSSAKSSSSAGGGTCAETGGASAPYSLVQRRVAPREDASPARARKSFAGARASTKLGGDVAGKKPLVRAGELRGGLPTGPKSAAGRRRPATGSSRGGSTDSSGVSSSRSSTIADAAGALGNLSSSSRSNSVVCTGGAGAEGEMALSSPGGRLGAVAPARSGFRRRLLRPPVACWAAFLFRRSMAMLWPGRTWASAHLCPNLQLPLTNHWQMSLLPPGSRIVWENGHAPPAVQPPTRKNLQGTCERSLAAANR